MLEQALKLGLDFGDLTEYGFDFKGAKCGKQTCLKKMISRTLKNL